MPASLGGLRARRPTAASRRRGRPRLAKRRLRLLVASDVAPAATAVTEASHSALAARARRLLGVKLSGQRDQVGQLAHRLEVAQRREPLEAERVQVVARQQGQVAVGAAPPRAAPRSGADSPRGSSRSRARTRPAASAARGPAAASRPSAGVGLLGIADVRRDHRCSSVAELAAASACRAWPRRGPSAREISRSEARRALGVGRGRAGRASARGAQAGEDDLPGSAPSSSRSGAALGCRSRARGRRSGSARPRGRSSARSAAARPGRARPARRASSSIPTSSAPARTSRAARPSPPRAPGPRPSARPSSA